MSVSSQELNSNGFRLDGNYHTSDGAYALQHLANWSKHNDANINLNTVIIREEQSTYHTRRLDRLIDVTGQTGLFRPDLFKRLFVDNPDFGIPYIPASIMLRTDPLASAKLLSVNSNTNIEKLALHPRMILLSSAGTIGNVLYINRSLQGTVGSQDIIRVVADESRIMPGYLYTYLSSPIARAIIERAAYGAVVSRIEPKHIENLPIPRLESHIENKVHDLIEEVALRRTEASEMLDDLVSVFNQEILGIPDNYRIQLHNDRSFYCGNSTLKNTFRLDAFHHVGYTTELKGFLKPGPFLKDIATVFLPGPFKRMYVGASGIPYLSGVDVYQYKPRPRLWLSPRQPELRELILQQKGVVLVQADGQRYGLIGRPAYTDESLVGAALSNHLVRILPKSEDLGGYIFLFLSTEAGRRELLRHSYGTSIPTLPVSAFQNLVIPKANSIKASEIGEAVIEALQKRTSANQLEDRAHEILLESLGWNNSQFIS